MIKQIILIAFKKNTPKNRIDCAMRFFEHIASTIDGIIGFECGESVCSGTEYSRCVILSLRSEFAKDMYLNHEKRHQLQERLFQIISDMTVVDVYRLAT